MKVVIPFILIFVFLGCVSLKAQPREDIYILFDTTDTHTCLIDTEDGIQRVPVYRVEGRGEYDSFFIYDKEFTFMKEHYKREKITVEQFNRIRFKPIAEMTEEWAMKNSNPPIHLIEKLSDSAYYQYTVGFIHDFIMINN